MFTVVNLIISNVCTSTRIKRHETFDLVVNVFLAVLGPWNVSHESIHEILSCWCLLHGTCTSSLQYFCYTIYDPYSLPNYKAIKQLLSIDIIVMALNCDRNACMVIGSCDNSKVYYNNNLTLKSFEVGPL